MDFLDAAAYLAWPEWRDYVKKEIGPPFQEIGRLYLKSGELKTSHWAQNVWHAPFVFGFSSIREAAKILKGVQRNWYPYSWKHHRRTSLIQENLPYLSDKPRVFPFFAPSASLGAWCLLDEHRILASARTSSPYPGGQVSFVENKNEPPSSAYLKLWEALSRLGKSPQPGELCFDAGACPGGWTWALLGCGARVIAVDRSPLDSRLLGSPSLDFRLGNAFAVGPGDIPPPDWLVCDIIAYPDKLYEWVRLWLASGLVKNYVVTLKMQGEADWEATAAFASVPGSLLYHGSYNKHELTWIYSREKAGQTESP